MSPTATTQSGRTCFAYRPPTTPPLVIMSANYCCSRKASKTWRIGWVVWKPFRGTKAKPMWWVGVKLPTKTRDETSFSSQECHGVQKAEPQRVAALESVQASALICGDENPSPLPSKTQRKYHFGSRSPSGQSPVTKSRKAPQNLLVSASLSASNKDGSDKETNSPKQKSWKHFVTNQFKKMQNTSDSSNPNDNGSECSPLSQCTPVSHENVDCLSCRLILKSNNFFSVGRKLLRSAAGREVYENRRD